jgi:YHYH protein
MNKIIFTSLTSSLLATLLAACGGAGTSATTPSTTPSTSATTSGTTAVSTHCTLIADSLKASTTGVATSTCDSTYAYVASNGLATHAMMNGITATNLQVPLAVDFSGANAWKIPLAPVIAAATTSAVDGPIGVAINGVPIFNPCKQGGCQNGDTKALGELDTCNGHAGRGDDYHYHAAPTCMMAGQAASYWNTHPVGWALDGFAIFGYNNADGTVATRDSICGGNTSAVTNGPAGYSYHVTDASPYVLSCFRGTPSTPARGVPLRQPPVTPFAVTNMTLTTDATDGYQVLQFNSSRSFTTTASGSDNYVNAPGTHNIRYKPVTGSALTTLLATNPGTTACWNFQFTNNAGSATPAALSYCR